MGKIQLDVDEAAKGAENSAHNRTIVDFSSAE